MSWPVFFQHPFYPHGGAQRCDANLINVPVPAHSSGRDIRTIVETIWLPQLNAFRPQMLFISAGFDAHHDDDMGDLQLHEADYAWITQQLDDLAARHCQGRIVSCLEGGYNPDALARCVEAHVRVLAGLPPYTDVAAHC